MNDNELLTALVDCLEELARGNPNPNLMDARIKKMREYAELSAETDPARRGARGETGKKSSNEREVG